MVAGFAALWLACGHDYASDPGGADAGADSAPPLTGDRFGKCFADGTCKVGLSCIDGLCLEVDAGGSGDASDGATPDPDAAADSGDPPPNCPKASVTGPNAVQCGADTVCTSPSPYCCPADGTSVTRCKSTCPSDEIVACDSTDDCASGSVCCFTTDSAQLKGENGCPHVVATTSVCTSPDQCVSGNKVATCEDAQVAMECRALNRHCVDASVVIAHANTPLTTLVLKMCIE